jgi:hypothetical protein
LVGRNIVKCERYPGTPEFDLIEGKQPKSEWNIWRQIKVVYSFQVCLQGSKLWLFTARVPKFFVRTLFRIWKTTGRLFGHWKDTFLCSLMLRLHPTTFFPSSFPRFLQTSHNFCWLLIIGGDMIRLHNLPTIAMYWLTTPLLALYLLPSWDYLKNCCIHVVGCMPFIISHNISASSKHPIRSG